MENKTYVYKKGDQGEPIEATVFYRPGESSSAKPIAVYYHGGNFIVGNKDMIPSPYVEKLLDLGFGAVVSANYRLAPTITAYDGPITDSRDAFVWATTELPAALAKDAGVKLDGDRAVAWGHSAGGTLALSVATAPKPPRAILDIFGMKYLQDEAYHSPLKAPPIELPEQSFIDQIFNEVPPPSGAPPPFGPKGIDVSKYRNAYLFQQMKNGTFMKSVIPDGKYDLVDPAALFSPSFPPTFFAHGSADISVNVKHSEKAHKELKENGVETEIIVIEGGAHGFDGGKKPGDPEYEAIVKGLEFLRAHV